MSAPQVSPAAFRSGAEPTVRHVEPAELKEVLAKGYADFMAMPSHLFFVSLIYPVLGIFLASLAFGYDVLPLLYPLISGFALVGPLAGIGLYELSRRRELGLTTSWTDAFEVLRSPALGLIIALGIVLVVIFIAWLLVAQTLYRSILGTAPIASYLGLLQELLTTSRGWLLIIVGNALGGAFAAVVLLVSVIGFPLILDRGVGVGTAIATSIEAVKASPVTMVTWGAIVAVLLAIGSIPVFVGLAVVLPILGHATWHLYRKAVAH